MISSVSYRPVGIAHSPLTTPEGAPIQGRLAPDVEGRIEVFPKFEDGLLDVEGFSHLFVLYHFHRSRGYDLRVVPFLDDREHGVFAVRAPKRPNPIGLSVVRLLRRDRRILHVAELDMLDGTPVLDIKPFIPDFDNRTEASSGWAAKTLGDKKRRTRADGRFK